jgi:hypothetical protein
VFLFSTNFFFLFFLLLFYLHMLFVVGVVALLSGIRPFDGLGSLACPDLGRFAGTVTLSAVLSAHLLSLAHLGQVTALRLPASKYTHLHLNQLE